MPILEIEGRRVEVGDEFLKLSPEQQAVEVDDIARQIGITPAAPQAEAPPAVAPEPAQPQGADMAADVLRSAATGIRSGVEGLAGLPGDARELGGHLVDYVMGKMGADEGTRATARKIAENFTPFVNNAPTSQDVHKMTTAVVGESYEPQTTPGEYAKAIGEFAPAAVAGPGSVARKAAMAVVPAVASETAGQVTEGTSAEPYARLAAALIGGAGVAGSGRDAVSKLLKEAPTQQIVKQETNALYGQLRAAGVTYDPQAYGIFTNGLAKLMHRKGFRARVTPKAAGIVDELADNIGKAVDFDELESLRRVASELTTSIEASERKAAGLIVKAIDSFVERSPISSASGMTPGDLSKMQKAARETASRNIKARIIDEMIEKAASYQSGLESGLRNQFSNLLRSRKIKSFSDEERRAIQEVAKGGPVNNFLGTFGRAGLDLSNLGNRAALLPGAIAGSAYAGGEPITGAIAVAAATAAKYAARKGTERAAENARRTVLSGRAKQREIEQARRLERLKSNVRRIIGVVPAARGAFPQTPERAGQPDS